MVEPRNNQPLPMMTNSTFFTDHLTAFELWLDFGGSGEDAPMHPASGAIVPDSQIEGSSTIAKVHRAGSTRGQFIPRGRYISVCTEAAAEPCGRSSATVSVDLDVNYRIRPLLPARISERQNAELFCSVFGRERKRHVAHAAVYGGISLGRNM
jgi:hypothetical protein